MRKPTDHSHKPPDIRDPETLDLAFKAHAFRVEFDALMRKHGLQMCLAHCGKWAVMQLQWPGARQALTIMRVDRKGRVKYVTEAEEDATGTANA